MISVEKSGFIGMVTNVAQTQAPQGALIDAENVVVRRPACVEPRDGVTLESSMNGTEAWGFSFDGKDIFARYATSTFSYRSTAADTYQYYDVVDGAYANSNPQPLRRDILTAAQARGNAYMPYASGVLKLTSGTSAFQTAGIPLTAFLTHSATVTTGTVWLPNNESVAYRAVCKGTDANGVVRRSVPTGQIRATNVSGSTGAVQLLVQWDTTLFSQGVFDVVEVYRSRTFAAGVTPDDELQLIATVRATVSGSATIVDRIAADARGATLYTSPSRGGLPQQNERPPACACVALFKGSLFFGNVRGPQRIKFSRNYAGTVTGSATGVGLRVATGDRTLGSPTILNVTPTTGLKKGMFDNTTGGHITNISGTTVTLSANSPATAVGATLEFYDAIKVSNSALWLPASENFVTNYTSQLVVKYTVTPPEGGHTETLVLEAITRATGSLTIQATHGEEYNPPLPDYDGTPEPFDQDVWPGAIMWSKKDEPEHVRPDAYVFVGDARKAVLGLVPTRDALFILKEDGVFRLTGSGATDGNAAPWRVDTYDPTLFCVLPNSVKPLAERAYFLSNKGVVAFDDGGSEIISLPINDLVKPVIDTVLSGWRSTGLYELSGLIGSFAAVYERENEYTLMRSSTAPMLVFNQNTGAWTTWKYHVNANELLSYKAVFEFSRAGRVIYALSAASYKTLLSTDSVSGTLTETPRFDRERVVTASFFHSSLYFVTLGSTYTWLDDDVLQDADGKLWRINGDNAGAGSNTVFVHAIPGASFTLGANCVLYRSLRCRVEPHVMHADPRVGKRWSYLRALFAELVGCVAMYYACKSSLTTTESDVDVDLSTSNGYTNFPYGVAEKALVNADHARGWFLRVAVEWVHSHGRAKLEGFFAEAEQMAPGGNHQEAVA